MIDGLTPNPNEEAVNKLMTIFRSGSFDIANPVVQTGLWALGGTLGATAASFIGAPLAIPVIGIATIYNVFKGVTYTDEALYEMQVKRVKESNSELENIPIEDFTTLFNGFHEFCSQNYGSFSKMHFLNEMRSRNTQVDANAFIEFLREKNNVQELITLVKLGANRDHCLSGYHVSEGLFNLDDINNLLEVGDGENNPTESVPYPSTLIFSDVSQVPDSDHYVKNISGASEDLRSKNKINL